MDSAKSPSDAAQQRLLDTLGNEPWAHDFFALLRRLDAMAASVPRLGTAPRPRAEPLRLGQDPELDFAPASLMSLRGAGSGRPPRLGVRFLGLFGPMGALPLHLTEYTRDRLRHHGDRSLVGFADIFHHRMLLLFYRAWAQAQPAVHADRSADDRFAQWVSALYGQAGAAFRGADSVPDTAKRFAAGALARPTRNAETIAKVLRQYFDVPVQVQPHVGHWLALRDRDRTQLGSAAAPHRAPLGVSAVAGRRVWDRQYRLRLHVGALSLSQYQRFLPGQRSLRELRDWMRQLLGFEMVWDLRLILRHDEVPALAIGRKAALPVALGWTTWLGRGRGDRGDLHLHPARLAAAKNGVTDD